jgi:uncharacterized protein YlxP (DUF503 family)
MFIGIMKIQLNFPPVSSIKEKRKIINRIKMKIANRFKVSIAEVDDQDFYNSSVLGLSFISNTKNHANSRGQNIVTFLENYESDVFHNYNLLIEEY